ncbi:hypothetical protein [Roseomonas sp. WA12]
MAKTPLIILTTIAAPMLFSFLKAPDTKAPEGASFKPDGKYKATVALDDVPEDHRAAILKLAKETFGENYPGDEDVKMPWNDGDDRNDEELHGKTLLIAKSKFQPKFADARGKPLPKGVFPRAGDKVRLKYSLFPYEKTENVREGKKTVVVKVFGVSARLLGVQVVERGQGGDAGGGFDAVEGGWSAEGEEGFHDETPASSNGGSAPSGDADF